MNYVQHVYCQYTVTVCFFLGDCKKDCRYGYIYDELGQQVCECATPPAQCPDLDTCSKHCNHGYKMSKKGCPKCRCNRCESFTCSKNCLYGYQTDRNGCQVCKCQGIKCGNCVVFFTFILNDRRRDINVTH